MQSVETPKLTRKQRRALERIGHKFEVQRPSLELKSIIPLTQTQHDVFKLYEQNYNMVLDGMAGSGKTFLSLYLALDEILNYNTNYNKLYICRSVVPSRDIGALPGSIDEKIAVYELPYVEICSKLFGRGDAYDLLKKKGIIEFVSTSYLRGLTYENCIIVVDEMQNLSGSELNTIITRVGKHCKILFAGDFFQGDLKKESEREGLKKFLRIINEMKCFKHVEFGKEDVVRCSLVKEYLLKKYDMKIEL